MMHEMWMFERNRKLERMKVAVAVIGGTALVGAGVSAFSGNQQANATQDAAAAANKTQMDQYNQTRNDQAPYRQAGYTALNSIGQQQANGTGFAAPFTQSNFQSDPGYQFQLQQGNDAIERSAASRGGLLSGAAGKALAGYTTGLANTTYGDAYNRYLQTSNQQFNQLATVAGLGQNSLNTTAQSGANMANNVANNTLSGATAAAAQRGSGYAGAVNNLGQGAGAIAGQLNYSGAVHGGNSSSYLSDLGGYL